MQPTQQAEGRSPLRGSEKRETPSGVAAGVEIEGRPHVSRSGGRSLPDCSEKRWSAHPGRSGIQTGYRLTSTNGCLGSTCGESKTRDTYQSSKRKVTCHIRGSSKPPSRPPTEAAEARRQEDGGGVPALNTRVGPPSTAQPHRGRLSSTKMK